MPNLPAIVQSGASVFTRGLYANEYDCTVVSSLFRCAGLVEEVPEHLLDTATGLSGSGPAYVSSNNNESTIRKDTALFI